MIQNRSKFLKDQRIAKRRRSRKIALVIFFVILFFILAGVAAFVTHLDSVSITTINVAGNTMSSEVAIQESVKSVLSESYLYVFSKNNVILMPAGKIRSLILQKFPEIKTVSVHRDGFGKISINVTERQSKALWCGTSDTSNAPSAFSNTILGTSTSSVVGNIPVPPSTIDLCYLIDPTGYVFATASTTDATTSTYIKLYGDFQDDIDQTATSSTDSAGATASSSDDAQAVDTTAHSGIIGRQFISQKDLGTIFNLSDALEQIHLPVDSIFKDGDHSYTVRIRNNGKIIFAYADPLGEMNNLKSALQSGLFYRSNGLAATSSSKSKDKTAPLPYTSSTISIVSPDQYAQFQYIDVRFGNKVFYKL